ncbi:protein kinase domain-containing protein [Psychromonas sp. KJ10-10]|uniref:protein kinase domain-containing protein n=1 Tax=Psychromonas sp. KJ10-10 TaxID=3391823 RepID=UPI0039B6E425
MAPEYLYTGETSFLSDLFSIGVITYELLSGGLPYQENNQQSLQKAVNTQWQYRDIQQFRSEIPKHLNQVLMKATNTSVEKRYTSMSEFVIELQRATPRAEVTLNKPPLIERHPVKFWKSLSSILFIIVLIESFLLIARQ